MAICTHTTDCGPLGEVDAEIRKLQRGNGLQAIGG